LIVNDRLDPTVFATHHFPIAETGAAYDVFADAAHSGALKEVLQA
jgi:alcohol dehydrogenase